MMMMIVMIPLFKNVKCILYFNGAFLYAEYILDIESPLGEDSTKIILHYVLFTLLTDKFKPNKFWSQEIQPYVFCPPQRVSWDMNPHEGGSQPRTSARHGADTSRPPASLC